MTAIRRSFIRRWFAPPKRFSPIWANASANPRFIVTNVPAAFGPARFLYERIYCQRGEMENRLKECQGDLFADHTPTPTMRANQLWLCAASGLPERNWSGRCGTIYLALLKLGARVAISMRRVKLTFASNCSMAEVFMVAARRLCT